MNKCSSKLLVSLFNTSYLIVYKSNYYGETLNKIWG
jgi:hypothetical protein